MLGRALWIGNAIGIQRIIAHVSISARLTLVVVQNTAFSLPSLHLIHVTIVVCMREMESATMGARGAPLTHAFQELTASTAKRWGKFLRVPLKGQEASMGVFHLILEDISLPVCEETVKRLIFAMGERLQQRREC